MQSLQLGLRSAKLLGAVCRSETLHDALSVAQRALTLPLSSDVRLNVPLSQAGLLRDPRGARRCISVSQLQESLFDEAIDVPVQCKVTAVLHTPTNINVATGPMERLKIQVMLPAMQDMHEDAVVMSSLLKAAWVLMQVSCDEALESNPDSYVLLRSKENSVGKALRKKHESDYHALGAFSSVGPQFCGIMKAPHGL